MICIHIPVQHAAGLTFSASVDGADHPGTAIVLHLRGPSQINLAASPDGKFSATATATAEWTPGAYWWTIRATNDAGEVSELGKGAIEILPDMLAAEPGFDGRSDNEKALDAIDAVLEKRASLDQERYRINNRELYRTPIAQLIKLRAFYAAAVAREKRKASGNSNWGRPVHVRFS